MRAQRILLTGLCLAIVGAVLGSGVAEARHRCCRGYSNRGRCCGNGGYGGYGGCNSGCGSSWGNQGFYNQGFNSGCNGGCSANTGMTTTNGVVYSNDPNQQMNTAQPINGQIQQVNGVNQQWNASTQQWVTLPNGQAPLPANQAGVQNNGTYSVSKPINTAPAPQPAPVNNTIPNNPAQRNTSPDVDNEGRGPSNIQGAAPAKAPLPAATTNP